MAHQQRTRRPLLLTFSGIDGAGKSTQIALLCDRLRTADFHVRRLAFWDDIAVLRSAREFSSHAVFQGDKGVGTPEKPVHRRDKNVRSWYMTIFRCCLYLLDGASLWAAAIKARRSQAEVVIFDRYLYDELANLPPSSKIIRAYIRVLLRFTPQPDVAFLFDADPVQARARKPEYPLEFIRSNRASYLRLSGLATRMTVIGALPVAEVARQVMEGLTAKLPPEGRAHLLRSKAADPGFGTLGDLPSCREITASQEPEPQVRVASMPGVIKN